MERPTIIRKSAADLPVPPNLADYAGEWAAFSWAGVRRQLAGLPGGGLNIAHEAVERHARGPQGDRVAFLVDDLIATGGTAAGASGLMTPFSSSDGISGTSRKKIGAPTGSFEVRMATLPRDTGISLR